MDRVASRDQMALSRALIRAAGEKARMETESWKQLQSALARDLTRTSG